MKSYQPLLVALIVGLLLTGCYYLPNSESTGDLSFWINARFTNPDATFQAFRMELFLEEDSLYEEPLAIGLGGARFIDLPANAYTTVHGPYVIPSIMARRRYRLGVSTWDPASTGLVYGPAYSNPFEVLPGQISYVDISFFGS